MYFREKVVQLRKEVSMTQDYFAKAVGVSRQAVYKWEKGKSYPEAEKLILIAKLFGVKVDSLLEDDYALFELTLPAQTESGVKDRSAASIIKPANKKKSTSRPVMPGKTDMPTVAVVAPTPTVTEHPAPATRPVAQETPEASIKSVDPDMAAETTRRIQTPESSAPKPLHKTIHKPEPKKQQNLFEGLRGLFGRKK